MEQSKMDVNSANTITESPSRTDGIEKNAANIRPWVRFFARYIDLSLSAISLGLIWRFFSPSTIPTSDIVNALIILIVWIFIESILLSSWGTTPGKWLLKIQLLTYENKKPTFIEAFRRSIRVWFFGMGIGIPIISLFTLISAYSDLTKRGMTSWDKSERFRASHGKIGNVRAAIAIILLVCIIIFSFLGKLSPPYVAGKIEDTFRQTQPFKIISEKNPAEFQAFIDKVKTNTLSNADPQLVQVYSRELIESVLPKYISQGSDQAISHYLQAKIDFYEKLYQINPELVVQIEYPSQNPIENIPPTLKNNIQILLSTETEIIESSEPNILPELNKDKANIILKSVIDYLENKYGQEAVIASFTNPNGNIVDKKTEAEIIIDFYKAILSLGPNNAGIVIRQMAADVSSAHEPQVNVTS